MEGNSKTVRNHGLSHHLFHFSTDWEQSVTMEYRHGYVDMRTPEMIRRDDMFWASNHLMRYGYD